MYFKSNDITPQLGALKTFVQGRRIVVNIKEILAPPASAQAAADELKQLRSKSLIDSNNLKRQTTLKLYIQRYLSRIAGVTSGRIQTFDVLAKYLKDNFHKLGARGVTPGADAIRRFDVYTAAAILAKADGTTLSDDLLREGVDISVSPAKYVPGAAQKIAYQFLAKADVKRLPLSLQNLKKEIVTTGAPVISPLPPSQPAIISPLPSAPAMTETESLLPYTSTVATLPAVVSSDSPQTPAGDVPLFTEAALDMGGIGGALLLGLGLYIFFDSGKRAFKKPRRRRG